MPVVWEAVGFTLLPHIGAMAGMLATRKNHDIWFKNLKKPCWVPNNEFQTAPIWITVYSGMGYASYLVYRDGRGFQGDAKLPLTLYASQLALNWAWAPIFFGMKSLKWGAAELVLLTGVVAATTFAFHKVNPNASYFMLPYLAALSLSSAMTIKLYSLNSKETSKEESVKKDKPKDK